VTLRARVRLIHARRPAFLTSARLIAAGARPGYATLAEAPVPIVTTQAQKNVALIGAARVHGETLTSLFSAHPTLDLSHGFSRQFAGFSLASARWRPSRTVTSARRTCSGWRPRVPSYPTARGAPFVAALDEAVAVDLNANYYFDQSGSWAYGLSGESSP
jgi:hypothetical protein